MSPKMIEPVVKKRLPKCPSGIKGLDEVTGGGLPQGRPTLLCGTAGAGKTLMAMEFLVRGAIDYGEPGVFMSFEESPEELAQNVASLGFDLPALEEAGKIALDFVFIERSQIEETGEYDLEGLLIRLKYAIDSIGAQRVVLDTVEALFAGLPNEQVLRSELRRLFRWLKEQGVTAVITGERGDQTLTRHGIEEYVSDAVILLDQRIHEQIAIRRLRVIKYRGSLHGADEYPFLITESGFSVLPVSSLGLDYSVSSARIGTGVPRLDTMLGGEGYYKGSSVLVTGTAGTGKSSLACYFADAVCRRGERCLYFALEESSSQIARNMRSIGLDLEPWINQGLLHIQAVRPTLYGLEMHLATMHRLVNDLQPTAVIIDPISGLSLMGTTGEVKSMLMRLVDLFKSQHITTLFTNLSHPGETEITQSAISSLMDTWLLLMSLESNGERNRGLYILKSRGMGHSNQIREFVISSRGLDLADVYLGPGGVLTGAARVQQETLDRAEALKTQQDLERRRRHLENKCATLKAQMASLEADLVGEEEELKNLLTLAAQQQEMVEAARAQLARQRQADTSKKKEKEDS